MAFVRCASQLSAPGCAGKRIFADQGWSSSSCFAICFSWHTTAKRVPECPHCSRLRADFAKKKRTKSRLGWFQLAPAPRRVSLLVTVARSCNSNQDKKNELGRSRKSLKVAPVSAPPCYNSATMAGAGIGGARSNLL